MVNNFLFYNFTIQIFVSFLFDAHFLKFKIVQFFLIFFLFWEFLRSFLTRDSFLYNFSWNFPSNIQQNQEASLKIPSLSWTSPAQLWVKNKWKLSRECNYTPNRARPKSSSIQLAKAFQTSINVFHFNFKNCFHSFKTVCKIFFCFRNTFLCCLNRFRLFSYFSLTKQQNSFFVNNLR